MKILFLGYQSIGHAGLSYLIEHKEDVQAVVTHEDDPHETIWWPSVADAARKAGIPVHIFKDHDDLEQRIEQAGPDVLLSFYFRKVIPARLLKKIKRGGLNMHGSYLPKYRGRAPANWVLVNGEASTGMTLHEMARKPDAGPIVDQIAVPIAPRETIATLYPKLVAATRGILQRSWPLIREGREKRTPQDDAQATTFGGRRPEDGEIHWDWPARRVDCLVRAVTQPYPGAFTTLDGRKILIWEGRPVEGSGGPGTVLDPRGLVIACGEQAFKIERADPRPDLKGKERLG